MSSRPKVLLTEPIHPSGRALLEAGAEVFQPARSAAGGEVLPFLAEAEGMIVRLFRVPATIMEQAPNLKVIGRHGVGVDTVDLAAAAARGIAVVYTPEANAESVAEHAIALLLALARRIPAADRFARARDWTARDRLVGRELRGKTLGIVGLGRIGRRVAEIAASGFGMRIIAFDPYVSVGRPPFGFAQGGPAGRQSPLPEGEGILGGAPSSAKASEDKQVPALQVSADIPLCPSLDELLDQADAITLHVPLTDATRNMIGAEQLRRMRPGSFLVNTSRGGVVDEEALARALSDGQLGGAALDVFATEPPPEGSPLLALENVVLSPHIASSTEEAMERMAVTVASDVLRVLRGEAPAYPVQCQAEVVGHAP